MLNNIQGLLYNAAFIYYMFYNILLLKLEFMTI